MTTTIATASKPQSPYRRLHVIIPIEDMLWASQQKPSITQLWQECWTSDPYGSRWMPLSHTLSYSTFIAAKKILSESGLFIFKPDKSIQDGRETVGWIVRNLHGSRMKDFWEEVDSTKQEPNSTNQQVNADSEKIRALNQAPISSKTQSEQAFQKPSRTTQEHLTNSSKEFVRCVSSTQNKIPQVDETAIAPFGGASPQLVESVEEKEESPTATDCTALKLADTAQGEPACFAGAKTLNQSEIFEWLLQADAGVCPPLWVIQYLLDSKYYASMRAAISKFEQKWNVSVVGNRATLKEELPTATDSTTLALAEDTQSQPTSLLADNQDSGVEPKTSDVDTSSAAPVQDCEKAESAVLGSQSGLGVSPSGGTGVFAQVEQLSKRWSSEALFTAEGIAARSSARPMRMEKLKMAQILGENPGFDFLQQCWDDDPALQIAIRKLLILFPQWLILCVNGKLIESYTN